MEPLEHLFAFALGNAGPWSRISASTKLVLRAERDRDLALGRRERGRRCRAGSRSPVRAGRGTPITTKGPRPLRLTLIARLALSGRRSRAPTALSISAARSTGSNVARLSSASIRLASAISLTSRSIRWTSWTAISVNWLPQARLLDLAQGFERASQRGERVLDLVRDVGGEAFDPVDPVTQGGGHVRDRAGQHADLVAPIGHARDHALRGRAPAARARLRAPASAAAGRWCRAR